MTLIVNQLVKQYGEKRAVNRISFRAEAGKAFGLLGGNGAGKTTTIRSILGLIDYDSGEILWEDKPLQDSKPKIGYLPEERGLYPKAKVSEQLTYFGMLEGLSKGKAVAEIKRWLERLEIPQHFNKRVEELSKGNQQKVQIISSLIHDPDLLFFDEPFSGLDPVNADMLAGVVKDLLKEGKTIIFSSHQMGQVEQFCENIAILKEGNSLVCGQLSEIKASYGRRNVLIRTEQDITPLLEQQGIQSVRHAVNEWELKVKDEDQAHALLEACILQGGKVTHFEIKEPTLHQIFIEKVGGHA